MKEEEEVKGEEGRRREKGLEINHSWTRLAT
jgi:hypothetical protein